MTETGKAKIQHAHLDKERKDLKVSGYCSVSCSL